MAPGPPAQPDSEGASSAVAYGAGSPTPGMDGRSAAGSAEPAEDPSYAGTTARGAATAPLHHPEEEIEDEVDDEEPSPSQVGTGSTPAVPPIGDAEMQRLLKTTPEALGPLSVGAANGGALFNGKPLPSSPMWDIIDPGNAWATDETIRYLTAAVGKVRAAFPDAPKMQIGHLSAKRGGPLKPHRSHQSGRDVDTSFFYRVEQPGWYRRATADNLDRGKTWAFVRALLTETDVEYIFINTSVQRLLRDHALSIGEDPDWLDTVFQVGGKRGDAVIRHAKGHDTHIHVRFFNPVAQELGRRAYPHLLALGRIKPSQYFVKHKAVKGDTLGSLARKYDTTVAAIQRANKLRGTLIMAKQVYLIPKERASLPQSGPVRIPPRRLPPSGPRGTGAGEKPPSASSAP